MYDSPRRSLVLAPSDDELCLSWRRGLSEVDVRALAADYMRGVIDPSTTDAMLEYQYRFGPHGKEVAAARTKAARKRKLRRK